MSGAVLHLDSKNSNMLITEIKKAGICELIVLIIYQ